MESEQEHKRRMEELNPYADLNVMEAIALIRRKNLYISMCFFDPGLPGSKAEVDLANQYFSIAEPNLCGEFIAVNPHSGIHVIPGSTWRGKSILVWFATHCDGGDFFINEPRRSSWTIWDLLFFLNHLKAKGFAEIVFFLNVCFSREVSNVLWSSFVDMQSGMTIGESDVHFFLHKHLMAIPDISTAAQRALKSPYGESPLSQEHRAQVRSMLRHQDALMAGMDKDIHHVYIPAPNHSPLPKDVVQKQ